MFFKILTLMCLILPVLVYSSDPAGLPVPPQGFASKKNNIPHGTLSGVLKYQTRNYGQKSMKIYFPPNYSTFFTVSEETSQHGPLRLRDKQKVMRIT
jgi:hypothetical protein